MDHIMVHYQKEEKACILEKNIGFENIYLNHYKTIMHIHVPAQVSELIDCYTTSIMFKE